jgi:predicted TIM-barrel fold metal-dependent hydrolase
VHVWSPDTKKYPIESSFKVSDMVPSSFTPEELFAFCKPEGVTKIVLIQMSFYGFDNQYMLDCMEKHAGVFAGVAVVDETKPDVVATMKKMNEQGVRGFRIYADRQKASGWQDSSSMKQMWSHAAESGQSMCLLANPDALPSIIAMCERYPKTRVVIDHFARIGVSSAINPTDLDNLCRLSKFENVFVKTSAFYALGKKKSPYTDLGAMIQRLVREFGANRLMWASDCPYQVVGGHNYKDSIGLVRDKLDFLTQEDKKWMLGGTAEKIFF